jgi:poly(A) polymerase
MSEANGRQAEKAIELLREATRGTEFEGRIYLVGGLLRDRALGLPHASDLDLVLDGDAIALAEFLYEKGLSRHFPVLYPRFGTAMISVGGDAGGEVPVELVSARAESYIPTSRKPDVRMGSLLDDAYRRDFTINTLMENLHTGEMLDLTGTGRSDLRAGLIRTPREPCVTFFDDPLRMLRAIRFAARFDFRIDAPTWEAVITESARLTPPAIAYERIREEFVKIVKLPGPRLRAGLDLLLASGLLARFLPEMLPMQGCTQNDWHLYDVWEHTLVALERLPDSARLETRLGLLWHDVAKPATRTEDERGVHFYGHPAAGAEMVREMMNRLKFSNEEIRDVASLVKLHMRIGEYKAAWADAPVKRLIRDCSPYLDDLFIIAECDIAASNIAAGEVADLPGLRARIDALNAQSDVAHIESPLNGNEIMELLGVGPGPHLREAKELLVNAVIDGRIAEGDRDAAADMLRAWWPNATS